MLGIRTANPEAPKQVWLIGASVLVAGMKHLADLDAPTEQLVTGALDIGCDQVKALGGAGRRRGHVLPKNDRAPGARRRELDHAPVFTDEVGVEPPPEPRVELLRSIDIRDGNNDDLEFHVDFRGARLAGRVAPRISSAGFVMFFLLYVQLKSSGFSKASI